MRSGGSCLVGLGRTYAVWTAHFTLCQAAHLWCGEIAVCPPATSLAAAGEEGGEEEGVEEGEEEGGSLLPETPAEAGKGKQAGAATKGKQGTADTKGGEGRWGRRWPAWREGTLQLAQPDCTDGCLALRLPGVMQFPVIHPPAPHVLQRAQGVERWRGAASTFSTAPRWAQQAGAVVAARRWQPLLNLLQGSRRVFKCLYSLDVLGECCAPRHKLQV